MMRDRPQAADLLAQARRELIDSILPNLASDRRYQVLMVSKAMDIAERELRLNPVYEQQLSEQLRDLIADDGTQNERLTLLAKRIRNGDLDASADLYALLQRIVTWKRTGSF